MPCPDCSQDVDYERVELVWPGKNRPVERVSLPFQTIERVNDVRRSQDAQAQLVSASIGGEVLEPNSEGDSRRGVDVAGFDAETGRADLPEWWTPGWRNRLIWGDNKHVLPSLLDEFAGRVDLVYIDPPFATGADFSYRTQVGETGVEKLPSILEEVAYRDMWKRGVHSFVEWFAPFVEMLKILLSSNGSIYLHCDPNISHYMKMIMETAFGREHFVNEITYERIKGAGKTSQHGYHSYGRSSEVLIFYTKSDNYVFNLEDVARPYANLSKDFPRQDTEGPYKRRSPFRPPGLGARPNLCYEYKGVYPPHDSGWTVSRESLARLDAAGELEWARNNRVWRKQRPAVGILPNDVWVDINQPAGYERVGYETQKPEALLERTIKASSNEGDLVLDCFLGSGTTAAVAEKLGRRWIGVDIGRFAIQTTRKRLLDIPGCRPFEVQNLGKYERSQWPGVETINGVDRGSKFANYIGFILDLYKTQPVLDQFEYIHGIREGVAVHVGATDSPVSAAELRATVGECVDNGFGAVEVLGWEWEMGINPALRDELISSTGLTVRLLNIPREILDERNIDAGDVNFFELSVAEVCVSVPYANAAQVELTQFIPAVDDYMLQRLSSVPTEWSDWIDYWSVDFEYDDEVFVNQWQSYRTRVDRSLNLVSDPHEYNGAGLKTIVVKVIDIFGNDTTIEFDHQAGGVG